jgi:predicted metalloprotease with PDZ domain
MDKMMTASVKYKIHLGFQSWLSGGLLLLLQLILASPAAASIPEPSGRMYPGEIRLEIDATDTQRKVVEVEQWMPVQPGRLTLLYPRYIPGMHSPQGPIDRLSGLTIEGNGAYLRWTRDTSEMHAFHIDVPRGVGELRIRFQFLSPVGPPDGAPTLTSEIMTMAWHPLLLYPAGHGMRHVMVRPSVRLPAGFSHATSLLPADGGGEIVRFAPVTLEELIDSPLYAGRHAATHSLGTLEGAPVALNLFGDSADTLAVTPGQIAAFRAVVRETGAVFGPPRFDRYHMLLALSNRIQPMNLEHFRSNQNVFSPDTFTRWEATTVQRYLVAHELIHHWNGKFRQPAGIAKADPIQPIDGRMLWVYEGLTSYYDILISARSGMWTAEEAKGHLAGLAATQADRQGRQWRPLEDVGHDLRLRRGNGPWRSWHRVTQDFYFEGALIWLEADMTIRALTDDRRSLDDFARIFFDPPGRGSAVRPYDLDDIVAAMSRVAPNDWGRFFRERVEGPRTTAPLAGLALGGMKLVMKPAAPPLAAKFEAQSGLFDLRFGPGLVVAPNGAIVEVIWGSPAFEAGITQGMRIVGVDGKAFAPPALKTAFESAGPVVLDLVRGDEKHLARVAGPALNPWLEPVAPGSARLDRALAPRTAAD